MNFVHPDQQLQLVQNRLAEERAEAAQANMARSVDRCPTLRGKITGRLQFLKPSRLLNRRCRNADCEGLAH
jgi:hypothetical protein